MVSLPRLTDLLSANWRLATQEYLQAPWKFWPRGSSALKEGLPVDHRPPPGVTTVCQQLCFREKISGYDFYDIIKFKKLLEIL